jgi:hypothetical protein
VGEGVGGFNEEDAGVCTVLFASIRATKSKSSNRKQRIFLRNQSEENSATVSKIMFYAAYAIGSAVAQLTGRFAILLAIKVIARRACQDYFTLKGWT